MRVDNKSVTRFLSQSDMTFIIPVYQRNYDWKITQCKQLIKDIEGIIDTNDSHFIGTVCIKPNGRYKSVIIDGQQRITTLLLIFKALYDISQDSEFKRKIKNRYLIDEFSRDDLKLKPIKKDEGVFKKLIINDYFDETDYDSVEKLSNIYINYIYIKEEINKSIEKNIYSLLDFEDALKRLEIVELELDSENPQIIFESLNSTGLDLSDSDLLRNYLLMSLKYEDQEYLYNTYWSKIEENLHNNHLILEDFLVYFLIVKKRSNSTIYNGKKAQITNNKLYLSFKRDYPSMNRNNIQEVEECFKEILEYSKYYKHFIFNDETVRESLSLEDRLFYDLVYLLNSKDSVIILMYLWSRFSRGDIDVLTLISCIKALISMALRASVCEKVGLSKQFSALLIQKLDKWDKKKDFLSLFWKVLTMGQGSYSFPSDAEFAYALQTRFLYKSLGSRKMKYLLYSLEEFENSKEVPKYSDSTIEHIMPQTLSEEWKKYLKTKNDLSNYESNLHLLGNLTLTGYNIELGNALFDEKKKKYIQSNYINTRRLKEYTNWTSKEIKERTEDMLKECIKIWELPKQYNKSPGVSLGVLYDLNSDLTLFTGTKPLEVNFLGGTQRVNNWNTLLLSVLSDCYEMDKQIFTNLLYYTGFDGNRVYFSLNPKDLTNPLEVCKSGIYVETANSTVGHLGLVKKVLEYFDNIQHTDLVNELTFMLSRV